MVDSVNVIGRGRVGSALSRPPARAGRRAARRRRRARPPLRARPRDRRGRRRDRARAVGRARQRRDAARRARSARAPLLAPPAPDVHASTGGRSSSTAPGRRSPPRPTRRGSSAGSWRPRLGLRPFDLADDVRALYHAGAAIASNYLVTLYRSASRLFEDAGAPPEALVPLMTPHDRERLPAHRPDRARRLVGGRRAHRRAARDADLSSSRCTACSRRRPRCEDHAHRRGDARGVGLRRRSGSSRPWAPTTPAISRSSRAAGEENDLVVASLFVNPAQFGDPADLARYPRDEAADAAIAEEAGVDVLFAPPLEELYPPGYETWVDVDRGVAGPRRRLPARPLPRRRDHLPQALQHRPARAARTSGRRTPSRSRCSAG